MWIWSSLKARWLFYLVFNFLSSSLISIIIENDVGPPQPDSHSIAYPLTTSFVSKRVFMFPPNPKSPAPSPPPWPTHLLRQQRPTTIRHHRRSLLHSSSIKRRRLSTPSQIHYTSLTTDAVDHHYKSLTTDAADPRHRRSRLQELTANHLSILFLISHCSSNLFFFLEGNNSRNRSNPTWDWDIEIKFKYATTHLSTCMLPMIEIMELMMISRRRSYHDLFDLRLLNSNRWVSDWSFEGTQKFDVEKYPPRAFQPSTVHQVHTRIREYNHVCA